MPIYKIEAPNNGRTRAPWDLTENILRSSPKITDWEGVALGLKDGARVFDSITAGELLDFFDAAALHLASTESGSLEEYSAFGISFLIPFLRRTNLERLLRISLKGNPACMDTFVRLEDLGKMVMARPRGLIVHWLAGNVPALGAVSLVQGILTKNANAVKLPQENGLFLPSFFNRIARFEHQTKRGRVVSGKDLAAAVIFLFCEKDDVESQRRMSLTSDVRVAWGGQEAVENVLRLPKKQDAEDVVFGPKYSLAAIGREALDPAGLDAVALRLAMDASVFEQRGCNSPHAAFVETGGKISPFEFARALASAMEKTLRRIPRQPVSAGEAYAVVSLRNKYALEGEVFASPGTEWTVIYSEEKASLPACGGRLVFVRPISDIGDVIEHIRPGAQTLGLLLDDKRRIPFAEKAAAAGIARITAIGKMSLYDHPWDGLFPMERFVRWVSLE